MVAYTRGLTEFHPVDAEVAYALTSAPATTYFPPASFASVTQAVRDVLPRINAMTLFNTDSGQLETWTNDSWLKHVMYNQPPTYGDTLSYNSVLARFEPTPVNNPVVKSLEVYGQDLSNGNYSFIVQPAYTVQAPVKTGTGSMTLAGIHTLTGSVNTTYQIQIDSSGTSSWDTATFKWSADGGTTWSAQGIPCASGSVSGHKVLSPLTLSNGVQILFSTGTYVSGDVWGFTAIASTNQRLKGAVNVNGVLTYESFIATDTAGVNSINISSSSGTAVIYFNDALTNHLAVSGKVATLQLNSTVGLTVDTTSTAAGGVSPYASLLMSNITTPTAVGAGVGGKFYAKGDNPTWQTGTGVETNLLSAWTLLTTKGDVYTFSTVPARLGIGADGTALVADSAQATGNKWTGSLTGLTAVTTSGSIIANTNMFSSGYLRVGANTAPTNTTAGDLSSVRLYVGANGTGLGGSITALVNGSLYAGYAAIYNSFNAPTNTTNGDVTVLRLIAGDATLASGVVLAAAGNATTTGYTRVGSATAPTNTTAGDLTAVRILAGDAALAANVVFAASSNATIAGYLNVGSASAPTNTTAGDLTAVRSFIPTMNADTLTMQTSGQTLTSLKRLINYSTATTLNFASAQVNFVQNNAVISYQQTGSALGAYFGYTSNPTLQNLAGNSANLANLIQFRSAPTIQADTQTITATNCYGMIHQPTFTRANAGTLTVTADYGIQLNATVSTGATLTTRYGFAYNDATVTGTLTNQIALDIANLTTAATLNIGIRNAATTVNTPSTQQSIAVSAPIVANATVVQVSTTTAANMTATPTVADGSDGQLLIIVNTGTNTFTLQDNSSLASSNLRLSAATIALGTRDSIMLMFSSSINDWIQIGQTNVL